MNSAHRAITLLSSPSVLLSLPLSTLHHSPSPPHPTTHPRTPSHPIIQERNSFAPNKETHLAPIAGLVAKVKVIRPCLLRLTQHPPTTSATIHLHDHHGRAATPPHARMTPRCHHPHCTTAQLIHLTTPPQHRHSFEPHTTTHHAQHTIHPTTTRPRRAPHTPPTHHLTPHTTRHTTVPLHFTSHTSHFTPNPPHYTPHTATPFHNITHHPVPTTHHTRYKPPYHNTTSTPISAGCF